MTEILISERTRPKVAVQLKVEVVKSRFEGPFRFLIKRALDEHDQHAGAVGGYPKTQRIAGSPRPESPNNSDIPRPTPAPNSEGE